MNIRSTWDDAQIHAYVDGELDAQSAARLEADSRVDAGLAARIAGQRDLRRLLQAGFDPVLDEPVPQRLRDAVAGVAPSAQVIALDAARRAREPARRPTWSPREWGAIAATLVLGTMLGAMAFRTPGSLPMETVRGRLVARGELDTALSTQLSGPVPGTATRIGLSFQAADGTYCRTFNLRSGSMGLACHREGRWAVQLLDNSLANPAAAAEEFRQAGSTLSPALVEAISPLGAGDALTREQEQQQLRAGWDAPAP